MGKVVFSWLWRLPVFTEKVAVESASLLTPIVCLRDVGERLVMQGTLPSKAAARKRFRRTVREMSA
jgi:hypothetical protein